MTPPTAALPIADCPNPECRQGCHVSKYGDSGFLRIVECNLCQYRGPAEATEAEAIRLHNLLCAPAVQATADAAITEATLEILRFLAEWTEEEWTEANITDIIKSHCGRKTVSPKAAQEDWKAKYDALYATINTPHTDEWFEAVRLEAGFQIERWGTEHDAGKAPMDWFWLIGYLAGKALASQLKGDMTKAKHHTISSGAALLNWFRAMTGDTNSMRPGHAPSAEAAGDTAAVSGDKQEKERE